MHPPGPSNTAICACRRSVTEARRASFGCAATKSSRAAFVPATRLTTFAVLPLPRSCPTYLRASTCHSSTPSLWSSARLRSANASPLYNRLVASHQRQQCRAKRRSVTEKVWSSFVRVRVTTYASHGQFKEVCYVQLFHQSFTSRRSSLRLHTQGLFAPIATLGTPLHTTDHGLGLTRLPRGTTCRTLLNFFVRYRALRRYRFHAHPIRLFAD